MESKNKKIIKNSGALYFRMLFSMLISIYTSRVILDALGIIDFGIYNVTAGIVTLFIFLKDSMGLAVTRFLGFAIGQHNDLLLVKTFKVSLNIHIALALIIVLMAECLGTWYMFNYLNIPEERFTAAYIIFQLSLLMMAIEVSMVPFGSSIKINEDIDFFAYISIASSLVKLGNVYILYWTKTDKLILFGILVLATSILFSTISFVYCRRRYFWCKFQLLWDKELYLKLFRFAGINTFGNMVNILVSQGLNMTLNFFFGPTVNAARGIAFQVEGAMKGFMSNIFSAIDPQIFKSYSEGNIQYIKQLLYYGSRISFSVLLIFAIPVLLDVDYILSLWLTKVPQYTSIFIMLLLINMMIFANIQPTMVAIHATARIGQLHTFTGIINLMNLFLSFFALKYYSCAPYIVFIIQIIINIVIIIITLFQMRRTLGFSIRSYIYQIYVKEAIILTITILAPLLYYLNSVPSFSRLLILCVLSLIGGCIAMYFIAIRKEDRANARFFITKKIHNLWPF